MTHPFSGAATASFYVAETTPGVTRITSYNVCYTKLLRIEMEISIEMIAEVCHEANRAYCEAMGDNSQVDWGSAPEWQRSSAVNGVKFHVANPGSGPSASHESWLA